MVSHFIVALVLRKWSILLSMLICGSVINSLGEASLPIRNLVFIKKYKYENTTNDTPSAIVYMGVPFRPIFKVP